MKKSEKVQRDVEVLRSRRREKIVKEIVQEIGLENDQDLRIDKENVQDHKIDHDKGRVLEIDQGNDHDQETDKDSDRGREIDQGKDRDQEKQIDDKEVDQEKDLTDPHHQEKDRRHREKVQRTLKVPINHLK